jgi:hypothetical protein
MDSILQSTKKVLGLAPEYTVFDLDITTHINAVFSTLAQLGVGPTAGFMIIDNTAVWEDFDVPTNQLNSVKTYVPLKVRMYFDPPTTSFLIEALTKLIGELEWRLNLFRELDIVYVEDREAFLHPPYEEVVW